LLFQKKWSIFIAIKLIIMKFRVLNTFAAAAASVLMLLSCTDSNEKNLPRRKPTKEMAEATSDYIKAIEEEGQGIHSVMVVKNGKVVFEKWLGEWTADKPHELHSVSKTFTATAVGMVYDMGLISLDDKVIDYFPEYLPETVNDNLKSLTIRHLLTMNSGFEKSPDKKIRDNRTDWIKGFLEEPFDRTPGTIFCYNSLSTYMLSAIIQKVTGEKVVDFLQPRLFEPLGITDVVWGESPEGITMGGWGLWLKTEDLAKLGQLFLQKGKWNGEQLVSEEWIAMAGSKQVDSVPAGKNTDMLEEIKASGYRPDWTEGYGFQMWMCRNNAFRADGAYGQVIMIIPDKDAVVVLTAQNSDFQAELDLVWKHIYPAL
jgi:CubicO group peptidase (beta-lactamase class C family)